jgi:hypothetical protein
MNNKIIQIPDVWEDFGFYLNDPKEASDDEYKAWADLNIATDNFLKGKIDVTEYTDYLSWYNVDVEDHLQPVDSYLVQLEKLF